MTMPSVKIVRITSGLGNQMFCYAFLQYARHFYPNSFFLLDSDSHIYGHNGLEIFKLFHCRGIWRWYLFRFIKKFFPKYINSFNIVKQNKSIIFEPLVSTDSNKRIYYTGFYQSERYFANNADKIRKTFQFKTNKINPRTKALSEELSSCDSVSIHIRRGDYLKEFPNDLCSENYYIEAINYIKSRIDSPQFYFFSDDIQWCTDNFGQERNCHFVDINKGMDSWQDMYLMTKCRHNIIANSTFSWWGAWLNNNKGKIVVAPNPWFRSWSEETSFDAIPDEWIKINNH